MTLAELYTEYREESVKSFDVIDTCETYIEKAVEVYVNNINALGEMVAEASKSVDEDLKKEKEGLLSKVRKALATMFKSFNDWVKSINKKFTEWSTNKKAQKSIKQINAYIEKHPELKNQKINVRDIKGICKTCDKYYSKASKCDSKIKSGILSGTDEIDGINSAFDNDISTAVKAAVSVTIVTALSLVIWAMTSPDAKVEEESPEAYYKSLDAFTNPDEISKMSQACPK